VVTARWNEKVLKDRQVLVDADVLKLNGEPKSGAPEWWQGGDVPASVKNAPRRRPLDAHEQFKESTFAGAIRSYNAVNLVSAYCHGETVHRANAAVILMQILHFDDRAAAGCFANH
jgi:hypothetical protein